MNQRHLEYCASDEWAELVRDHIVPGATRGVELGDHLLEVGPGPGRTTELLRTLVPRLTAVELDPALAAALGARMRGTNVSVVEADATALPMPARTFSAAISLTMLHHIPVAESQDRLFAEVARVLRPCGVFLGSDNLDSPEFREAHVDDICNPIDPASLPARLEAAGFTSIEVETNPFAFRFRARKPG